MYGAETLPGFISTGKRFSKSMLVSKSNDPEWIKPMPRTYEGNDQTGVLSGSLGALAKSMSVLVQSNLLQNEILLSIKDAILGTPQERKEDSISAGDTDKPPKEKGPGILIKELWED